MPTEKLIKQGADWIVYFGPSTTTVTPVSEPPVAALTLTQSNLTTTYSAAGSTDPGNLPLTYDVNWGDGSAHSTGVTNSHTYAAAGSYTVTLTVKNSQNLTDTDVKTATPTAPPPSGGGGSTGTTAKKNPWISGSPTEGLPSSVHVYKWSDLATSSADNSNPMAVLSRMSVNGVVDISNEQITIPSFAAGTYPVGLSGSHFQGFIGGISNGSFNNQVTLAKNAMTLAQAQAVWAQTNSTSNAAAIRTSAAQYGTGLPTYMMGVHFVGSDQQSGSEAASSGYQYKTGPARFKGIDMDTSGPGSIFQNCLLQGFNYSSGSTPPWEVGMVDMRRSNGFIVRRVELDGMLPVGSPSRASTSTSDPFGYSWKRSGGFQWNADKSPRMYDFSIHSGLVSGLTFSIASVSNNGSNNTEDIYMQNLYVEDQSTKGFSGVNLEDVLTKVIMDHPTIIMNSSGGNHIGFNAHLGGINAPNIPSSNFVVTEPTWSGGPAGAMFAIRIAGWGGAQTSAPTVIKNGVKLIGTTTKGLDPAKYYFIAAV